MGSVPGTPGEDYPILSEVPETAFSCKGQKVGGEQLGIISNKVFKNKYNLK
jgi:hypothetical protein